MTTYLSPEQGHAHREALRRAELTRHLCRRFSDWGHERPVMLDATDLAAVRVMIEHRRVWPGAGWPLDLVEALVESAEREFVALARAELDDEFGVTREDDDGAL